MKLPGIALTILTTATLAPSVDLHAAPQAGTITGTVNVRERENGDDSLLIGVDAGDEATTFDYLHLTLPEKIEWKLSRFNDNWTLKQDGKRLEFTGPATGRLSFRLDARPADDVLKDLTNKKCRLRAGRGSRTMLDLEYVIQPRDRVSIADRLDGALNLPPLATEGEPFFGTVSVSHSRANGTWTLYVRDDAPKPIDIKRFEEIERPATSVYGEIGSLTGLLKPFHGTVHPNLRFTFTDRWGETLIDAPGDWRLVPKPDETCVTGMTGGSSMVFAGKHACASGCFGDLSLTTKFLLNGTDPLEVRAATPRSVALAIPPSVAPGQYFVTFASPGGSKAAGRLGLQVLGLQGTIDQNQLWRGQSTMMRLDIKGSDAQLPLEVLNRTPSVIDVEGGVRQTIVTPGGPLNGVARSVRGIRKGDFAIDYTLALPPCGLPQ